MRAVDVAMVASDDPLQAGYYRMLLGELQARVDHDIAELGVMLGNGAGRFASSVEWEIVC
jgi:hypothetical protein